MKKIKLSLIIAISFLLIFIILCYLDFILDELNDNQELIVKILEIVFAASASFAFSISININTNKVSNSDILSLSQVNGNGNVISSVVHNNNNNPIELMKAIKEVLVPYQETNINSIMTKACDALKNEIPGMPLNTDFVLRYIQESSHITNSDIQDIWIKLLLQENKSSGSISKRTLDIVKNLYAHEAKLFENISKLSIENGKIYDIVNTFDFLEISKMQDVGLIKSNDLITETITIASKGKYTTIEEQIILIIENTSNINQEIELGCKILTSEGNELKTALGIKMGDVKFLDLCQKLKDKFKSNTNLKFTAHKINYIIDGNVNYNLQDLLH